MKEDNKDFQINHFAVLTWDISLPMCTIKEGDSHHTLEEHPVGVSSQAYWAAHTQGYKHWNGGITWNDPDYILTKWIMSDLKTKDNDNDNIQHTFHINQEESQWKYSVHNQLMQYKVSNQMNTGTKNYRAFLAWTLLMTAGGKQPGQLEPQCSFRIWSSPTNAILFWASVHTGWLHWILPVERESQPWSKSSPSGDEVPVRRACLPSMASRLW